MTLRLKYCQIYTEVIRKGGFLVYFVDKKIFHIRKIPDYAWAKVNTPLP